MKFTAENLNIIMALALPLVGWLMKRLGSRIPAAWSRFVTALDPETLDMLVVAVGTKQGRETMVRNMIQAQADKFEVELTDLQMDTVINGLERCWKAGLKFAGQKKS